MATVDEVIAQKLKNTIEQIIVVGPIVKLLTTLGWDINQIIFGKQEWYVPKTPHDQTSREKGRRFEGFPVDIAIFDEPRTISDPRHVIILIECKQPNEQAGLSQLEAYFVGEPHAQLGIWVNNADPGSHALFVYRAADGSIQVKRRHIADLPRPGEALKPESITITFNDLIVPSEGVFKRTMQDLLDIIVSRDANVTRREEQLDQLCNMLLLKLDSDKEGKADPDKPVYFRTLESTRRTVTALQSRYQAFVALYPDIFVEERDKTLRFSDDTIASVVEELSGLKLIDSSLSAVAVAFQVLRAEALKEGEGQYFTPIQVIEAGIRLLDIQWQDIVLDPACGTGGFLLQTMRDTEGKHPGISPTELTRWAQAHIYGIDKDAIAIKLSKAIMQIAGDGSADCVRGDSILTYKWATDYRHLLSAKWDNNRFSVVVTNPPFGRNLTISDNDARLSDLEIAKKGTDNYKEIVIGLAFFERAYEWLRVGGRIGIVLPETYFFSTEYNFIWDWIKPRLKPLIVANVPMEAFQGYARAKTNFYIFEKIVEEPNGEDNVTFLNPKTCGIYKSGHSRYKIDEATGRRTEDIDNELMAHVEALLRGESPPGLKRIPLHAIYEKHVLVPTYYDDRYDESIWALLRRDGLEPVTLGELEDTGVIQVLHGHGSPSNDRRTGEIPYIKVSDIRGLRINTNPTNLVSEAVARELWRGESSGLNAWDIITPNRASSNIGEFSILLPGEEKIVLTKEVFVLRIACGDLFDPFYLLWALSLKSVREQWRRITLMQTNREDCGDRYREIIIPKPRSREWAQAVSRPFTEYFENIATSKQSFIRQIQNDGYEYVANVRTIGQIEANESDDNDE